MFFRRNKGITLLALTITITVMVIISGIIIQNTKVHVRMEKVNKLFNDIESLNTKIEEYYMLYGDIPIIVPTDGSAYCTKGELKAILEENADNNSTSLIENNDSIINENDGDEYYIIDLEKLENLNLNYGYSEKYNLAKTSPDSISISDNDEVYIINKVTHQIYYPAGVVAKDFMYYTYDIESENVEMQEYNIPEEENIIEENATEKNIAEEEYEEEEALPTVSTCKLNIDVMFPNAISSQPVNYTAMSVSVINSQTGTTKMDLGNNSTTFKYMTASASGTGYVTYRMKTAMDISKGSLYNIKFEGLGYRTFTLAFTPTQDCTVTVWNNVMSNAKQVIDYDTSKKYNVTFLAGEMVADGKINSYDLNQISAYYSESTSTIGSTAHKCDLNRDKVVDTKDYAIASASKGK